MLNSVDKLLKYSALLSPQKVSFVDSNGSITYSKLDELSDILASKILDLNIQKSPILIILPKGINTIISFFGVLKSGNFYTIIDENMPLERINKIIQKLNPALLITNKDLNSNLNLKTI